MFFIISNHLVFIFGSRCVDGKIAGTLRSKRIKRKKQTNVNDSDDTFFQQVKVNKVH